MQYNGKGRLKPKHTSVDGITFDSAFESKCFGMLKKIGDITIHRQYELMVIPSTKNFAAKKWKVDFAISGPLDWDFNLLYVEAKAIITPDFLLNVHGLDYCDSRDFRKLLLCFPTSHSTSKAGEKQVKLAEKHNIKYTFLCDLVDTVKAKVL